MATFPFMGINNDEKRAAAANDFEDDTDEAIVLPKPTPEITYDDERNADSSFGELEIDVDEDEVKAERGNQPAGRKY